MSSNHKAPLAAFVVVAIACVVVLATNGMRSYARAPWLQVAAPVVEGVRLLPSLMEPRAGQVVVDPATTATAAPRDHATGIVPGQRLAPTVRTQPASPVAPARAGKRSVHEDKSVGAPAAVTVVVVTAPVAPVTPVAPAGPRHHAHPVHPSHSGPAAHAPHGQGATGARRGHHGAPAAGTRGNGHGHGVGHAHPQASGHGNGHAGPRSGAVKAHGNGQHARR